MTYSRCRTTRAPASSNRRMLNSIGLLLSHAFSPKVDAALPLVAGSIHDRGLAAPTSLTSLTNEVIITIAIARVQNPTGRHPLRTRTIGPRVRTSPSPTPWSKRSSGPILPSKTTEGSRTRVLPRCYRHRRVGQAYQGRRSRVATPLSWLMPNHPCRRLPTQTSPTFSTTLIVTDIAGLAMEGTAVPLQTASQSTARMTMLPSHRVNAAGYALHPPQPVE